MALPCAVMISVLLTHTGHVFAQDVKKLTGVVLDSATLLPITDVHIWSIRSGSLTNKAGQFVITVLPDDSICFSHVNYKLLCEVYGNKPATSSLIISLTPLVRVLDEVNISSVLSEEAFRQKIIETQPMMTREETNAQENSATMRNLLKIAPAPAKTDAEVFFETLEGPKGVTILSTRPGRGLIQAIRQLTNPPKLRRPTTSAEHPVDPSINPFRVRLKKDSVATDSVKVVYESD